MTLPYAFHSAGVGLSISVLLFMGSMSILSTNLILEVMARAAEVTRLSGLGATSSDGTAARGVKYTAVQDDDMNGEESGDTTEMVGGNTFLTDTPVKNPLQHHANDTSGSGSGNDSAIVGAGDCFGAGAGAGAGDGEEDEDEDGSSPPQGLMVHKHKYEITELCDMFMGSNFKNIYTVVICVYMYGTLWVFSAVFGKALAYHMTIAGSEDWSYAFYLFLFACLVVPTSCMELREQVYMQCILAALRIVMMVLMLMTVLPSLLNTDLDHPFLEDDGSVQDNGGGAEGAVWGNIHHIITIGAYAFIFHHSVPSLSQPVKDKKSLSAIFSTTISFCLIGYSLLGTVLALYFGKIFMYLFSTSSLTLTHAPAHARGPQATISSRAQTSTGPTS